MVNAFQSSLVDASVMQMEDFDSTVLSLPLKKKRRVCVGGAGATVLDAGELQSAEMERWSLVQKPRGIDARLSPLHNVNWLRQEELAYRAPDAAAFEQLVNNAVGRVGVREAAIVTAPPPAPPSQ